MFARSWISVKGRLGDWFGLAFCWTISRSETKPGEVVWSWSGIYIFRGPECCHATIHVQPSYCFHPIGSIIQYGSRLCSSNQIAKKSCICCNDDRKQDPIRLRRISNEKSIIPSVWFACWYPQEMVQRLFFLGILLEVGVSFKSAFVDPLPLRLKPVLIESFIISRTLNAI